VLAPSAAPPASPRIWRRIAGPRRVGSEVGTYTYGSRYLALAGPANDFRYAGTTLGTGGPVRWLGHYRFDGRTLELDQDRSCRSCPGGGRFEWAPGDSPGESVTLWPVRGSPAASYWATPTWSRAG
jgi:hypothetical protein